jgi:hypothetical protein
MLGDTLRQAPTGLFVFIPRGTPHTRQNVGAEPLRFFATIMPAAVAFEEFFKRYAQLPAEERGVEAFARVAAETKAFEVVGPPLAESDPSSAFLWIRSGAGRSGRWSSRERRSRS